MQRAIVIYGDYHYPREIELLNPWMIPTDHGPAHVGRPTGAAEIKRAAKKRRNQMRQRKK